MNKQFFAERISRGDYFLLFFLGAPLIVFLEAMISYVPFLEFLWPILGFASLFIIIVLFVVLTIKRLHDINTSAWYVLVFLGIMVAAGFVPIVGHLLFLGALFMIVIFLSIKKGTVGPNKFGNDPVYRKMATPSN